MITIPILPKQAKQWRVRQYGKASKMKKNLIDIIIKTVLSTEKIKNQEIIIEVDLKNSHEISELNQELLGKTGPTDTISIPIDTIQKQNPEHLETKPILLGTIILCLEEIKKDAHHLNKEETMHLAHIVTHSTLHILGYTHDEEEDKKKMEAKEVIVLSKLGISSPYL